MSKENDEIISAETPAEKKSAGAKLAIFFSCVAILIAIAVGGFVYWQTTKYKSLAKNNATLENQLSESQNSLNELQKSFADFKASTQNSLDLSAKQEKMIADWQATQQGDLNKWYVAEAQYLVKLANDHMQYTQDMKMVAALLQRADQVLANIQDANLLDIRKSIATDVAQIQAVPDVDATQTYLRLNALNTQIDQLKLPFNPLQENTAPAKPVEDNSLPWWKKGFIYFWQGLQKIVVVRYNEASSLPLVMPEEKLYIYQNMHAQIEQAIWGLLHRDNDVYQASLTQATAWLQKYFVQDDPITKQVLQTLQELQKANFQTPKIDLAATLQLFDQYLNTPKATQ